MPKMTRHGRLGLDEHLFKEAVAKLAWAKGDTAGDAAVAKRLNLSLGELSLFYQSLLKSEKLTADEQQLFRRVASLRPPEKMSEVSPPPEY